LLKAGCCRKNRQHPQRLLSKPKFRSTLLTVRSLPILAYNLDTKSGAIVMFDLGSFMPLLLIGAAVFFFFKWVGRDMNGPAERKKDGR
jgi:hypothetical protein